MSKRHLATTAGLAAAGVLLLAGPASAHIEPTIESAPAGSYATFSLQVPHGCGEGGTNKIEVKIPDGITSVTPEAVPGWTVTRTSEALNPPVDDGEGGKITERTDTITWAGGPLAHDQLLLFGLSVKMPDTPGESISFPVIQSCDNGQETDWIEIPKEGEDEPEHPAPTIELTAATGDHHGSDDEAAADTKDTDDDSDSSSNALGILGIALGAVGIGLGTQALRKTRQAR
jgi:uncharacterized protein YcnI